MEITTAPIFTPARKNLLTFHGLPLYVYAVSIAALSAMIGILWDISWHRSIGRDKFLSPPHLLIYMAAILGGLFSGTRVIVNSFFSPTPNRNALVRVWGIFYSSLGALFCIWGAVAMLTSAPFDDWWHNAYGLDVKILSPPHVLLTLGMLSLQFGACVTISKYMNEIFGKTATRENYTSRLQLLRFLFIVSASSLLCMLCTLGYEYMNTRKMHVALFYQLSSAVFLLMIPAFARALRMKWAMTAIALGYLIIVAGSNWILQLFPAEPKLGPVMNHVTNFQPLSFPILFFIPALATDWLLQNIQRSDWKLAVLLSLSFLVVTIPVQYSMSSFLLLSPSARNWFFGSYAWNYNFNPAFPFRFKYLPEETESAAVFMKGIFIALIMGLLAARAGLKMGKWMQNIQR